MAKNRNRTAGHNYELEVIKSLKHLYPDAVSSRSESKNLDNKQVDICYTGTYHIQCKNMTTKPDYHVILNEMPKDKVPIIFHKKTKKKEGGTNFISQGEYVIMKAEDFIRLLEKNSNTIFTPTNNE